MLGISCIPTRLLIHYQPRLPLSINPLALQRQGGDLYHLLRQRKWVNQKIRIGTKRKLDMVGSTCRYEYRWERFLPR